MLFCALSRLASTCAAVAIGVNFPSKGQSGQSGVGARKPTKDGEKSTTASSENTKRDQPEGCHERATSHEPASRRVFPLAFAFAVFFAFSVVRSSPRRSSRGGSYSLFPMIWLSREKVAASPRFFCQAPLVAGSSPLATGHSVVPSGLAFHCAFIFFPGLYGSGGSVESFASIERTLVISWVGERGRPTPLSVPTRGMRLQDFVFRMSRPKTSYVKSRCQFSCRSLDVPGCSCVDSAGRVARRLERFSNASHAPRLTPLRKGGKSATLVFPLLRRGDTGGFFECLRIAPGSSSKRLKTDL